MKKRSSLLLLSVIGVSMLLAGCNPGGDNGGNGGNKEPGDTYSLMKFWAGNASEEIYSVEENETSANNSNSNNTSNNSSNNGSTTNNNTITKINLNNNISITEYHVNDGTIECFYYMFPTNLKEVFPEAEISKINNNPAAVDFWHTKQDRQAYEVSTEEINEYLASGVLKINNSAENNFKNILNKYKNGNYKGIANVTYTEDNHRFTFSYDYISFNGLNVSANGEQASKEIQNSLYSSTKFMGPCGEANSYENKTLTEELCSKYNLDCDRW